MIARSRLFLLLVLSLAAVAIRGDEPRPDAVRPREVVHLFNGQDLAGPIDLAQGHETR